MAWACTFKCPFRPIGMELLTILDWVCIVLSPNHGIENEIGLARPVKSEPTIRCGLSVSHHVRRCALHPYQDLSRSTV